MKCYNSNCKEECYDIKRAVCINRITEEQHLLILAIRENDTTRCRICGSYLVDARIGNTKRNKMKIKLCTSCKKYRKAN